MAFFFEKGMDMTMDVTADELRILNAYRAVKQRGHGELTVAVRHAQIVKLWTIDKWDRDDESKPKLKEDAKP